MMKILGACAVAVLASGCATIVDGSTQKVSVTTDPVVGANCELKNPEGVWRITTPGTVEVSRAREALNVTCAKDGYPTTTIYVQSKMNAMTLGNIIAGGVIGVVVDSSTGANTEYETPISVSLTGTDNAKAAQASPAATTTTAAVKPPGTGP